MDGSKAGHYKWLVEARTKSQKLLLCLFNYQIQNEDALKHDPWRSVFALLVGAAFSLWRAAFLSNTKRQWPEILEHTNELLDKVLKDNAISFQDELKMREWMGGFYLNNARYRLTEARDTLKARQGDIKNKNAFKRLDELNRSGIEGKKAAIWWDILYDASQEMYNLLERSTKSRKRR